MKKIDIIAIILGIVFLIDFLYSTEPSNQNLINFQSSKLKYILETADKYHIDSLDVVKACDAAFDKLLKEFDFQSEYYPKKVMSKLYEKNQGLAVGIGIDVVEFNDTITVTNVARKSPADSLNIKVGDKILFVNDNPVTKMSRANVLGMLSGDTGTVVSLIIKTFIKDEMKTVTLPRKVFESFSISSSYLINGTDIGYIGLNRFSDLTDKEFQDDALKLKKLGAKKIILDLRGNPGGYLGKAVNVADQFLKDGLNICETKSKSPEFNEEFKSKPDGIFEDTPLIVLVDTNSASGSEVLAGAVQDNDRGLILGQITYGKATAQRMFSIVDSTAFRITVAEYFTPLGRKIQKIRTKENDKKELDPSASLAINDSTKKMLERIINDFGGKTEIPIYKTPKGRTLISNGGIFPDIRVDYDSLTILTNVLLKKGIFLEWSLDFLKKNHSKFEDFYEDDFINFQKNFVVTNELIVDFANFAVKRNSWNNEMFKTDKERIVNYMKAFIAFIRWGTDKFVIITHENDDFVKTAINRMKDAEILLD